ncbi:MAG: sugar phosphate isomerase/epimerase [Verrucomicrobiales bacterium]|jgi:sugar phosphate isomerase/epimerase
MLAETIKIGTLAGKGPRTTDYVRAIQPHGFECFQINFDKSLQETNLPELATQLNDLGADVSCLGIYGNPLGDQALDDETRHAWEQLIDHAPDFGTDLVCGFTGRVSGESIPDSIPRYAEVFGDLSRRAADRGVRIAFENCPMGGSWNSGEWNLAHNPPAWELLFNAIPSDNIGLEWEPCHQMCQMIEPLPQIREWGHKFFHIHGKDANVRKDLIQKYGIIGKEYGVEHRHPGFGDCNWTHIISELRRVNFHGSIDIEGWHDPVYKDDLELSGQVHALAYLKSCRTNFVPNPEGF